MRNNVVTDLIFSNETQRQISSSHLFVVYSLYRTTRNDYSTGTAWSSSSVIRQKGESQNGGNKKTKHANFPKNERFLRPDSHTYVCESGGKKCSFFGKFGVLCFLVTFVLRFALLSSYY